MAAPDRWLLLHGTPLTPAVWDGVRGPLAAVRPVLAPALPAAPTATAAVQAWIASAVLEQVDDDGGGLHVVGHSFGGQVALEVALQAPERVRSLAVVCSRATPFPAFAAAADGLRAGGPVDADGALGRWFSAADLAVDGPVVQDARRCLVEVDRARWADELDAIATYDRSADLARITAPTTLVAAELDHVGTPEAMAAMAAAIPAAGLDVIAGASHMTLFLAPDDLAARLIAAAATSPG